MMNVFYLSSDPYEASRLMVDKHVVKMILESAQLLSTAHRVLDGQEYIDASSGRKIRRWKLDDSREQHLYSATHMNHPSAKWVRESDNNYNWLFCHFHGLLNEYTYRYSKHHKCTSMMEWLSSPPKNIPNGPKTQPPCAMDKAYVISEDAVVNYRNYYKHGKSHILYWTKRPAPAWIADIGRTQFAKYIPDT